MTIKDIVAIAGNPDAMYILDKIREEQENLCYKTEYEKKTAKDRMKELAKAIQEII